MVLATRSDVGTKAFDLKTRHLVREMDGIVEPRYAPREKRLYTLRLDPPEHVVWDVSRWEIVATLPTASGIDRPVFSPDSRLAAW